jgi:hypothetical protein
MLCYADIYLIGIVARLGDIPEVESKSIQSPKQAQSQHRRPLHAHSC